MKLYQILNQYEKFKIKHYFISKDINTYEYYQKIYCNKIPKIISTFIDKINISQFKIIETNFIEGEYIGESIDEIYMNIFFTNKNRWLYGKFKVKVIFKYIYKYNVFLPIHLINIE